MQPLTDGFVIACGTVIEECEGVPGYAGRDLEDCRAGLGDTRSGATNRAAGVWQPLASSVGS